MALIKLTAFIDQISGKLNGTVFAKNKGGQYVRSKSKPSNPKSTAQNAVRGAFGALSSVWSSLSDIQRNGWNQATQDFKYINRLGDTKTLSGFALHQQLNRNLQLIEKPILASPPPPATPNSMIDIKLNKFMVSSGALTMTVQGIFADIDFSKTNVLIYATGALSPGVGNFDNKLRLITTATATSFAAATSLETFYTNNFPVPAVGSRIGLAAVPISNISGQAGVKISVSDVIASS